MNKKKMVSVKNILLSLVLTFILFILSAVLSTDACYVVPLGSYPGNIIPICSGFPMRIFNGGFLIVGALVNFIAYFVISFPIVSLFLAWLDAEPKK